MLEKMKMIESLDFDEILELKQALLAYDLGLESSSIRLEEIDKVENAFDFYYENDDLTYFVDERIIDAYNEGE